MPHKNVIRHFAPESFYHCYNRGVEQRQTFMDEVDYGVFLNRLKQMLTDPENLNSDEPSSEHIKSFYGDVELLAYCLMPNHFHLLLYQKSERGVSEFMRTLSTSYTMYFNKRYKRVGSLFQGTYKARHVDTESYWLHISRYIHLNPLSLGSGIDTYQYSSMKYYHPNAMRPSWLQPRRVLECFDSYDNYASFVREYAEPKQLSALKQELSLN